MGNKVDLKGFIINEKHLIIAKNMRDSLLLAVEENILDEENFNVRPMPEEMNNLVFYHKIGDLNNVEAIKSLFTFYKDETVSLKYNGEYILSEEKVSGFLHSKLDDRPVILCSKLTESNKGLNDDTWMRVDQNNKLDLNNTYEEEVVEFEAEETIEEVVIEFENEKELQEEVVVFENEKELQEEVVVFENEDELQEEVMKEFENKDELQEQVMKEFANKDELQEEVMKELEIEEDSIEVEDIPYMDMDYRDKGAQAKELFERILETDIGAAALEEEGQEVEEILFIPYSEIQQPKPFQQPEPRFEFMSELAFELEGLGGLQGLEEANDKEQVEMLNQMEGIAYEEEVACTEQEAQKEYTEYRAYNVFPNQANPIPYDVDPYRQKTPTGSSDKAKKPWQIV